MSSNKGFDPNFPLEARRVHVIAVDGSDSSDKAFDWAVRNTDPNDRFVVAKGRGMPAKALMPGFLKDSDMKAREDSANVLTQYEQKCKEAGRICNLTQFEYDTPLGFAKEVCRLGKTSLAADIIMGSRGLSKTRALFGSSSAAVLNNCDMPITIIKANIAEDATHTVREKITKQLGHEY